MAKRPGLPTIERAIHFYRAQVGVDGKGKPLPFDPAPALAKINKMPFANSVSGRYLIGDDGNAVCAWPGKHGPNATLRFCQIRRTGLPQLEDSGVVSDLTIATTAGLLEAVHVMFFSDNIVGADFNFYGPRLSRLGYYLMVKSQNAVPLATFEPLLRRNVIEQLDHLTEIRLIDFKVRTAYVDTIRKRDNSLADAFEANARVLDGDVDEIEIILRPARDKRGGALKRMLGPLKSIARGDGLREHVERFQVKGKHDETGKVELIDLLHDQLIVRKQMLRLGDRNRAVDANSAFGAISAAHDEIGVELRRAASLSS